MGQSITPAKRKVSGAPAAMLVYGLQALSFFTGLTRVTAILVLHRTQDKARASRLYSHDRRARRTFWLSLLWAMPGMLLLIFATDPFIVAGTLVLMADALRVIYRIVRGGLGLHAGRWMTDPGTTVTDPHVFFSKITKTGGDLPGHPGATSEESA